MPTIAIDTYDASAIFINSQQNPSAIETFIEGRIAWGYAKKVGDKLKIMVNAATGFDRSDENYGKFTSDGALAYNAAKIDLERLLVDATNSSVYDNLDKQFHFTSFLNNNIEVLSSSLVGNYSTETISSNTYATEVNITNLTTDLKIVNIFTAKALVEIEAASDSNNQEVINVPTVLGYGKPDNSFYGVVNGVEFEYLIQEGKLHITVSENALSYPGLRFTNNIPQGYIHYQEDFPGMPIQTLYKDAITKKYTISTELYDPTKKFVFYVKTIYPDPVTNQGIYEELFNYGSNIIVNDQDYYTTKLEFTPKIAQGSLNDLDWKVETTFEKKFILSFNKLSITNNNGESRNFQAVRYTAYPGAFGSFAYEDNFTLNPKTKRYETIVSSKPESLYLYSAEYITDDPNSPEPYWYITGGLTQFLGGKQVAPVYNGNTPYLGGPNPFNQNNQPRFMITYS